MQRLNDRAFNLLQTEIRSYKNSHAVGQVQIELVLRRLNKLHNQTGTPLNYDELKDAIVDLIPQFDDRILRKAAQLNRPPSAIWTWIKLGLVTIAISTGGIWLVNRPIPWIRYPVMQAAPFLLTPSYMAMDHDYRSAVALVEQADQLVNEATAFEDLVVGTQKVKAAQRHLDQLPAWFLGHYPGDYCRWAYCGWRFTVDEFRSAREAIARMDAKLFQEKNAQTRFEQAEQTASEAAQRVRNGASEERSNAIADWQASIDTLEQLPRETLAGRLAQTKLLAAKRDLKQATEAIKN